VKVLVTGGAGFIGSNFVTRSLATRSGLEITVLDSLTYAGDLKNLRSVEGQYKFVHGDIRNADLVEDLVSQADLVVHFAAESHNDNSLKNPQVFVETNVFGTLNLVQAAAKFSKRFHHISTDEVFGDLPLESKEKFSKTSPYNPSSPYSASKASSDHLVRAWVRSFGLRATISNCSNNFGPNQHAEKLIPRTIALIAEGKNPQLYGTGLNVRDWIHVDDHVDGVWAVIDNGTIGETYLLGANQELTNVDVVTLIAQAFGLNKVDIDFVPERPGHDRRYAIDTSTTLNELGWQGTKRMSLATLKPLLAGNTN
jgi:dTDP-glucose 4,6-dehydratase